ncbi:MAG TPA: hypothetical protein VJ809_06460 [Pirellulales bacterium]|jgi:hypothetical protein|nr:hypothetical protein [Pirellulales bacterium]
MQTWCRCLAAFISAMGIGALSYAQSSVSIEKELFITDLAVVNHAAEAQNENGAFHIRTLLDAMAPTGKDAKDVVLSLLGSFRDSANPDLPMRLIDERVINPWKRWPPGATAPNPATDPLPTDQAWNVNWRQAPFRLLAIVNRIDLRHNPNIGNAGEGRFVFGVTDAITGDALLFTVILEYIQPAQSEAEVRKVAADWHALGSFSAFNDAYVDRLKIVTRRFAGRNAAPTRLNASAIGQIRTNEIALNPSGGAGWELREFVLAEPDRLFHPATVKLTPHHSLNNTAALAFLLRRLSPDVSEALPAELFDFRAITDANPDFQWQAPGFDPAGAVLRRFSVNTCSGCHGGDAKTAPATPFLQVAPRPANQPAVLAKFLTGTGTVAVVDPGTGRSVSNFSDLELRKLGFELLLDLPFPTAAPLLRTLRSDERGRSIRVH